MYVMLIISLYYISKMLFIGCNVVCVYVCVWYICMKYGLN